MINYKVRDWLRLKKFSHYSVICCKDPFILLYWLLPVADIFCTTRVHGSSGGGLGRKDEVLSIQGDCIRPQLDWDHNAMDQFPVDRRSVISADSADWDACDNSSTLRGRRRVIDK